MLKLTHNDYFVTQGTGPTWNVSISKCKNKIIQDFYRECIQAAKIVYENSTSPLTLLYSGGLDSEFMLRIFKKANIPFKTAIISYGEYNKHDTDYAFNFCNLNKINPIVVDIDIDKFVNSGRIYDIANQVHCCAYQMPSIMEGISKLDGTVIMGNGEPYLKNYKGNWVYQETERVNSYMKWYEQQGIDGTPDFLRYTPEVTLSFLLEDRIQELVKNVHPGKLSTRTSKHYIYSKNFTFDPRPKYTGWEQIEKISPMIDEIKSNFIKLQKFNNGVYELPYDALLTFLRG